MNACVPSRRLAAIALIGVLSLGSFGLSGCSGGSSSSDAGGQAEPGVAAPAPAATSQDQDPQSQGKVEGPAKAGVVVGNNRKVSRGEVVVTVDDLAKAASQVRGLGPKFGGYVSTESMGISSSTAVADYSTGDGDPQYPSGYEKPSTYAAPGEARIELRVEPEQTAAAMDGIAGLGKEVSRWRTDTDVEAQLVDLESRIKTQTTSLTDLRRLLGSAKTLSDIITLESEINSRTADLESLKAQQRALSDDVSYSTVTAVLRTPDRTNEAVSEEGFLGGLKAGWSALLGSVNAILTITGALLPFALVFALIAWPVKRWLAPRLRARSVGRREQAGDAQARQAPLPVGPPPAPARAPGDGSTSDHSTGSE